MRRKAPRIRMLPALVRAVVVGVLLTTPVFALDPQKAITQFKHRSWGADRGLGTVVSIAQTTDGYIWVGTADGTFRFDGLEFTRLEPGPDEPPLLPQAYYLLGGRDGSLWTTRWEYVLRLKDGHVRVYGPEDGVPKYVVPICEDRDGAIWVGGESGIARFSGEKWQPMGEECGLPKGRIRALMADHENTLWAAAETPPPNSSFPLVCLRQGDKRFHIAGDAEVHSEKFAEGPDGRIWLAQVGRSVRSSGRDSQGIHLVHPEIKVGSQNILFDRDGGLWITTVGDGLRRIRNTATLGTYDVEQFGPEADKFTQKDGLSSDVCTVAFEDREGNIWVGTTGGLDCFGETKVTSIAVREGLPFDQNLLLQAASDGSIWAGSTPHGFEQLKSGGNEFVNRGFAGLTNFANLVVSTLYVDPTGDLFLGTGGGVAVVRKGANDAAFLPGIPRLKTVQAMTRDKDGVLWLCDHERGIRRVVGDQLVLQSQPPGGSATAAHTDSAGRVWLGFASGGVACYEGAGFTSYHAKDGLFSGFVREILSDARGEIWAYGKGGISRFANGRFQTLTRRNGLPDEDIFAVLEDEDGFFWLGGWSGLFRVAANELENAFSPGAGPVAGELFSLSDGLLGGVRGDFYRGGKCGATKSADGRLWFATGTGLAIIDPRHIPRNPLPPAVHIQQIAVAGKKYQTFEHLEFPNGTRSCAIDYVGLSFVNAARVRYRYKLDGFDEQWGDATALRQAVYSNLKPKRYKFQVRACNNDGVWNETGDSLEFSILPAFYERAWFPPLCALPVALAAWGLYRFRLARITGRMRLQLEGQIKERKRIAQELHDTLLQGFTGVGLKLDAIASKLPESLKETREQLEKILNQSDQYLTEARRSVWELRSTSLEKTDDFAEALSDSCGLRLEGTGIQLGFSVEGARRKLPPIVEDNLLRICEEAVTNAVKHARPTQVKVNLEFSAREARLRIRDNGCGFDPQGPERTKAGHFGLAGLQERVRSMAGSLSLNSQPGKGTEIIVSVAAG